MCRQESGGRMSSTAEAEEIAAAEESLSVYCKPVEFYNIIQRRAIRNPLFLQRCLSYKIEAKHKKRIQMTVSLSKSENGQHLFPLSIYLARLVSEGAATEKYSAVYQFNRVCMFNCSTGVEGRTQVQANFVLPDINKLASEVKSGSICVLLVSHVGVQNSSSANNLAKGPSDMASFPSKLEGYCLWGKISLESLYTSWENSPNFSLGQRAEMMSTINMCSCFFKLSCSDEGKYFSVEVPYNLDTASTSQLLQVTVSAEEFGAREKSPYNSYVYSDVPSSSLSNIIRLRDRNVIFNYRYYNNKLQRTEVTEDFSCPFCLVKCGSFKGLRLHLTSSHDLFNFEFWVTEEYQAVNVSVKIDSEVNYCKSVFVTLDEMCKKPLHFSSVQIAVDGVDPKLQVFLFLSKPLKRRRTKNLLNRTKHVYPYVLGPYDLLDKPDGISQELPQSHPEAGCVQLAPGHNLAPPAMLQFAKTRKLSVERSDPRNCALLRKRQFFHSHRAQPMALEQVLSDRDSEDEVDDDVADLEDRRMLDDFVDVSKDEKQMMHMWNSFVRKQRVLADGHIPWACEGFTKLHGPDLVRHPSLMWCWRLFMIKLWNHGLLDARNMNICNSILQKCQSQALQLDPKD